MENRSYNREKGKKYEGLAAKYLSLHGYNIVECNYSNRFGEIDIIAWDGDYLTFIEVKYRKNDTFGNPLSAIDQRKQAKIRGVANAYLYEKHLTGCNIRFDAVAILGDDITCIKDAF